MTRNYVTLSLETHLFFARIMKEHSMFLMAGFPCKEKECIEKADLFREQFENLLRDVVRLSDGRVRRNVLESCEIVTEFTEEAECKTSKLTGIKIDGQITKDQHALRPISERENRGNQARRDNRSGCNCSNNAVFRNSTRTPQNSNEENTIRRLNRRALELVDDLISFKEDILKNVGNCCLFTANYPLLIEHILREAKMYRSMIRELERTGNLSSQNMMNIETFWNQIMMEHALFIRGLLDPCEEELICTAHQYSMDYKALLEEARTKNCMVNDDMRRRSHDKTVEFRDFKATGTKGISECEIDSIILPLLADHVLREANHYLRLLEQVEGANR